MAEKERGIRRYVRLILDRASAKRVEDGLKESLRTAGDQGSKAFLREIRSEFDSKMAALRHKLSKGLIDEAEFRREADAAARAFNTKLSAAIDNLRAKGQLTDREFQKLGRTFKRVGDEGSGAMGLMQRAVYRLGFAIGAAFSIRALFNFGRESVRIAAEADADWNRLAGSLRTVGVEMSEVEEEVRAAARAMQDTTTIGDEEFASILQRLISITGDYAVSLRNVGLVADVAAGAGLDLEAAARLVGRALVGDTATLRRYGIVVREGEDAMAAMRRQFDGMAANEAQTLSGQLTQLTNEWGDFREELGGALVDIGQGESVIQTMTRALRDGTTWLNEHRTAFTEWSGAVASWVGYWGPKIGVVFDQLLRIPSLVDRAHGALPFLPGSAAARERERNRTEREFLEEEENEYQRRRAASESAIREIRSARTVVEVDAMRANRLQEIQELLEAGGVEGDRRIHQLRLELTLLNRRRNILADTRRVELSGAPGAPGAGGGVTGTPQPIDPKTKLRAIISDVTEAVKPSLAPNPLSPSMAPVSAIDLGYDTAFLEEYSARWREEHEAMESVAVNAAHGIANAWKDAFSLMFEGFDQIGAAAEAIGRGIGAALLGALAQFASGKIAENVAQVFENLALASAAIAKNDPKGAAFHYKAAGEHGVAAAKWGVVAGMGGAAQGAVAGGGGGGRSGGLQSGAYDPAGRLAEGLEQRGHTTIVYIDPIDANNPVHVREVGKVVRNAVDRGHVKVHVGKR